LAQLLQHAQLHLAHQMRGVEAHGASSSSHTPIP
jgi:hypothetical protein